MTISKEKLVSLRSSRGWTQARLSEIAGVSERTIQRAEKDGTCSMDTQMAIASAFDLPFAAFAVRDGVQASDYRISWSAAVALFVVGLAVPLIVLLTAQNGPWELASFGIVIGAVLILSSLNFGGKATYELFDKTSWLIRYPLKVHGLRQYIKHAESIIHYAYISGVLVSVVTLMTIKTHELHYSGSWESTILLSVRPLVYAALFVELWFRPFKKKLQTMRTQQAICDGEDGGSNAK